MEGLRRRRVVENLQKLKKIIDLPSTKEEMIKELYGIKVRGHSHGEMCTSRFGLPTYTKICINICRSKKIY
ncbi:hypothetical protein D915_011076 [Fasciola hepatica]|uniref:Uncharacterized protein n=1 Tax=Fasciola hepatica TaxID=6192 RepID=A0A4E0QYJ4_FASHE|nr:hypothetical protein D915_011076 [Fasciola hepatica]